MSENVLEPLVQEREPQSIPRVVSDDDELWQWAVSFGHFQAPAAEFPRRGLELPDSRFAGLGYRQADEGKGSSCEAGRILVAMLAKREFHYSMPDLPDRDVASWSFGVLLAVSSC